MLATNCITKIPQDIKLELNNGTLTLKAGSKIYVPNGVGKFDVVVVQSDKSWGQTTYASGSLMLFYRSNYNDLFALNDYACYSGSSAPTANTNMVWYDTTNGKIKWTSNKGSTWNDEGLSFPLNNSPYTNGTGFTSIDQVFNGFGYIGSTVFGLPGVKVLMPNGRNADGTLKNLEITTNSVILNSTTQTYIDNAHYNCVLNDAAAQIHTVESGYYYYTYERPELGANKRWYSEKDNMWYTCFAATPTVWTEDTQCIVLTYTYHSSAPISDFEIKAPISVVNQSMSDCVVSSFVDATTGQWYRRYKSGWLEQGGKTTPQSAGAEVSFLLPFSKTQGLFLHTENNLYVANTYNASSPAVTTTGFIPYLWNSSGEQANGAIFWYACGQGA